MKAKVQFGSSSYVMNNSLYKQHIFTCTEANNFSHLNAPIVKYHYYVYILHVASKTFHPFPTFYNKRSKDLGVEKLFFFNISY